MLKHLIIAPRAGLCNRLRAIASARRICKRLGARCSIIWDWGQFRRFFAPLPDARVHQFGAYWLQKWVRRTGIELHNSVVDVSHPTLKIWTCQYFRGHDEPSITLTNLRTYIPTLSATLAKRVEDFANCHFGDVVGLHMRRSDNKLSRAGSPDELFLDEARRLLDEGKRIFLATDNAATGELMRRICGDRLITYPKQAEVAQRWPRSDFQANATEDDLIDLFLLARTEYVLGCYHSSYSSIAIALNGSPRSRKLTVYPADQVAA